MSPQARREVTFTPNRDNQVQVTVYLEVDEATRLAAEATEQERSLGAELRYIIRRYLAEMNGAAS